MQLPPLQRAIAPTIIRAESNAVVDAVGNGEDIVAEQWTKLFAMAEQVLAFIKTNKSMLKTKEQNQTK